MSWICHLHIWHFLHVEYFEEGRLDKPQYPIEDVFDGKTYRYAIQDGYFRDPRDVAVWLTHDGFVFYSSEKENVWVILAINYNIRPEDRVKLENMMPIMIIPGKPKDLHSFFTPLYEELKELQDPTPDRGWCVHALTSSADLPASSVFFNMKEGSNCFSGCRACECFGYPKPGAKSSRPRRNDSDDGDVDEEEGDDEGKVRKHYYMPLSKPTNYPAGFEDTPEQGFNHLHADTERMVDFSLPVREVRYTVGRLPMRTHQRIIQVWSM